VQNQIDKGVEEGVSSEEGVQMPRVTVNGTELYYEVRGTGPPVLLIMGGTGDGGHLDALADVLADEFVVVSYDRRGNGRSPVPPGWQTTSAEEQADDAAALLNALGTGPTAVFGTSSGGNFALCLMIRHPEWVRGAILHEPGLYALVYALADDFEAFRAPVILPRRCIWSSASTAFPCLPRLPAGSASASASMS
jgi:pimeloyl-ACP methyl ester carboxylesterase